MNVCKNLFRIGVSVATVLLVTSSQSWAFTPFGGMGGFGGESRGLSGVGGRVLCARCDLAQVQALQPHMIGLYELQHRQGQVVMQLARPEDASDAAWWEAIVGMKHIMAVRTPDYVFAQLLAEENLNRRVGIQGMLRPTRTYDIVSVTYLEDIRGPISSTSDVNATNRAEVAATQAEDAASKAERAADRLEAASKTAEAECEERLRK